MLGKRATRFAPIMTAVETALAVILLLGFPIWGWYDGRMLRLHPEARLRSYIRSILVEWLFASLALFLRGRALFTLPRMTFHASQWLSHSSGLLVFIFGMFGVLFAVSLLQILSGRKSEPMRAAIQRQLKPLAFLLPGTRAEIYWFAALCVTAGITEEILYRGFLIHYLASSPWHASVAVCLAASAVVFGLGHIYQGLGGTLVTTFLGLMLGFVFLSTGHLLLPILLHAALDLRALALACAVLPNAGLPD
jgi:uncharacterized protein